jgi:replicative DNA helicase
MRQQVTSEILDRLPPFNLEAEMHTLGSILENPQVLDDLSDILRPEDFYDDANGRIYRHLRDMHEDGRRIDLVLLGERLQTAKEMELIGGAAYLAKVSHSVIHSHHATYYAEIVRDKSIYRSLIFASTETLRDAYDESTKATEILSRAEASIFTIGERAIGPAKPIPFRELMHQAIEAIDARRNVGSGGIKTGVIELDKMIGGFKPGQLVIVAGRPSMGKTALGHNIAEVAAREHGTLFISMEMGAAELGERALSSQGRVDSYKMRNGTTTKDEKKRLIAAMDKNAALKWETIDTPGMTVSQITSHARRAKRRSGLELLIVDYLNLIEPDSSSNPRDSRQEQVAKISRRLKLAAKELQIPVICLCQLSRLTEVAKDNKPRLSHLRESGAIEQDADIVIACHRAGYYANVTTPPGQAESAELIVLKQRNGPTGELSVLWFPSFTRWDNTAKSQEQWKAARYTGDGDNSPQLFDEYKTDATPNYEEFP